MLNLSPIHWPLVKRILKYLKGTLDVRLCLGGMNLTMKGYCDAEWSGNVNSRRSTIGYVFFLGEGPISWSSKRQPTIALSTMEAKYMAASQLAKEAIWLRQLIADVGCMQVRATLCN